tara:strand:+ start:714 stop:818 length:105 start_codon:yes stop_codon:yes gene_type:complete
MNPSSKSLRDFLFEQAPSLLEREVKIKKSSYATA